MKADAPEQLPISLANAGAGALWVGLVAWSLTAAPGPLPDPIGPELVAKLAAQPVPRPADINEYATQGSNPGLADRAPGRPALTPVRLTLGRWCKNVKLWLLFAGAVGLIVPPSPSPYPYQARA